MDIQVARDIVIFTRSVARQGIRLRGNIDGRNSAARPGAAPKIAAGVGCLDGLAQPAPTAVPDSSNSSAFVVTAIVVRGAYGVEMPAPEGSSHPNNSNRTDSRMGFRGSGLGERLVIMAIDWLRMIGLWLDFTIPPLLPSGGFFGSSNR
jgi:hypothetical protein